MTRDIALLFEKRTVKYFICKFFPQLIINHVFGRDEEINIYI